jgi:SPP1 gp7 family putative phage head morphogenesis protein
MMLNDMQYKITERLDGATTEFQRGRLTVLLADIDAIINADTNQWGDGLISKLDELAEYETDFITRLMSENTSVSFSAPAPTLVQAITQNVSMSLQSGRKTKNTTIRGMINTFSHANQRQVSNAIRAGVLGGETPAAIVRNIKRMVTKRTQAQAYAIVRTATNAVTTEARDQVYRQNKDILEGLEWVSVLDSRTTFQCAIYDGQIFPIDSHPPCPRHYNCRSLLTPKVKDRFALPITGGTRASVKGPVNALSTYEGWIKKQPAAFQDEFLGKERGRLFRSGGLKLEQFTDSNGRPYTMEELRALEPLAFERANLD